MDIVYYEEISELNWEKLLTYYQSRGGEIMELSAYQKKVGKSVKDPRDLGPYHSAILDWTLGLCGESGEVADMIKHHIFHFEPLVLEEIAKEIGDVLWYLAALCSSLKLDLGMCAELNIAKLEHRHGKEGYSVDGSTNRHGREENFKDTEEYKFLVERIEDFAKFKR